MSNEVVTDEIRHYQEVRKRVGKARAIRIFVYHLIAYALGNIFLGAWNIFTFQNRGDEILWFYFPLIFWGVGVIIHYVQGVALFNEWWDQDEINTERTVSTEAAATHLESVLEEQAAAAKDE